MTQNTNLYLKKQPFIYLQEAVGPLGNPIVKLALKGFNMNGQFQQSLDRFLEWGVSQIALQGKETLAKRSSTQAPDFQQNRKILFPVRAAEIILDALQAMDQAEDISELHSIVKSKVCQLRHAYSSEVLDKNRQTEEGISIAHVFLLNQVGLRTIQLVLPKHCIVLSGILRKFYLDDKHPMDLQKLLRDPVRSSKVGYVMRNLTKIDQKACPLTKHLVLLPQRFFNSFLATYVDTVVQSMNPHKKATHLLGVQTIELNTFQLRVSQENYYSLMGVSKEQINNKLQFSTPSARKGIYLYPHDKIPSLMEGKEFIHTDHEVFLRVPDADNRVVAISKEGFQVLEKLQLKMTQDLFHLMQKLNRLFPDHMVTARVKSARSFLDKCGPEFDS